jgi:hypothetical protein
MAQSTIKTATIALPLLLMMLIVVSGPARALPIATGSKCDSSWVNNAGAMDCFVQGEDESTHLETCVRSVDTNSPLLSSYSVMKT